MATKGSSMKVIFVAERNQDSTEGRGPMVPIAYFEKRADAQIAAKGQGVMGAGNGEVNEVMVFASIAEWHEGEDDKLRKSALSKLTDAEKRALGIKEKR